MAKLADSERPAIFAEIVEIRSFAGAAVELKLSKATVSKAVSRIEARLIDRTSRPFALTDVGRRLAGAVYGAIDMPWAKLVGQIAHGYGK